MSESHQETQKIQDKLSDVANELIPSKIASFKKTLTRAKSMVHLLPLFKKEEESKMYAPSSLPRSHSEPILIPSLITPSIATELFSAGVKDIEALEIHLRPKVSKAFELQEKLAALLEALSMRNENLQNPFYTHSVLVDMKEFIQCCLSLKDWKKIESYVEGLLEQAIFLSQSYQYHQGLLMVEALFDFLLELPLLDDFNLKAIEEKVRKIEVIFHKRELFERLMQVNLPKTKAILWEALVSSLVEERSEDAKSFAHSKQEIQDTVHYGRKVIQETAHIFVQYENPVFLLKVEEALLALKESKFEKEDIKKCIVHLSDLNFAEKFHHVKDYVGSLDKLKPNPAWPKVIAGFEKAMALCPSQDKKTMEQRKILRYFNQLIDSFNKYKKFPILMLDAWEGLIWHKLFLVHLQKENEKIGIKLHDVAWAFAKIEKIYFKMEGREPSFLESVEEDCIFFLQKDKPEEEVDAFLTGLLDKIHSRIRREGILLVERFFEEMRRDYQLLLQSAVPSIEWEAILSALKEKITRQYREYEEIISFDQGLEPYLEGLLDSLKALKKAFSKASQNTAPSLKPFKSSLIHQIIQIHWFLNTEVVPEITRSAIAYQIKLSGVHAYAEKLSLVRQDIPWDRVIAILEEDIKSSCESTEGSPLGKQNLDECIEEAVKCLENLKVGLMAVPDVKDVPHHPKYPTYSQAIGDFLVFRDSLHEGGNEASQLLNLELDRLSKMLQNGYRAAFLSREQRIGFLRCVEEISLKVLVETGQDTTKTDIIKIFTTHLKNLYSAIDDRELNPKSKRSILYFLSAMGQLLGFRTTLFSSEEEEKCLLSMGRIIKFLDVMGKMPIEYLTFKFLSEIEAELTVLLFAAGGVIIRTEDTMRKLLVPKLANIRKAQLCKLLLPLGENNGYLQSLAKIMARELDKGSMSQDRESAELSSDSEDSKKREEACFLIKQLKTEREALEKSKGSAMYLRQCLDIAQTAVFLLSLYTKNEERKDILEVITRILGVASRLGESYELEACVLEKIKTALLDFCLKKPLPSPENLQTFAMAMERNLKESLIGAICGKYKLTMSILIELEEAFLPSERLTLEEFSHKVQHRVKEILELKRKAIHAQYAIESRLQKIEVAQKESLKLSTKRASFVSRSLNMKEEEYEGIKKRFIALNEDKVNLQRVERRLDLCQKKALLSRMKDRHLPVLGNEEEMSDFFLEMHPMAIKEAQGNAQKINEAIDSLIKDIDNIIKAHPFLGSSPHFFVRFRQSEEDKELARNLALFKRALKELKKSTLILDEKMECLGKKVQEMDEALSLFLSQAKKVSPRREKTLTHFQKILKGEGLDAQDRKECVVSFCADNQTIKAARGYAIFLLEREIDELQKGTNRFEPISEESLCEEERRLREAIEKETAAIQGSISCSKMRQKLRSERSSLERKRTTSQSKNTLHADLKSLEDLSHDYFNVQLKLTRLNMVLGKSPEKKSIGSEALYGIQETVEQQAREVLKAQDSQCSIGIIKIREVRLRESIRKLLEAHVKIKSENEPSAFIEPVVGHPFNTLGSPYFFGRSARDKEVQWGGVLRSEKQGLDAVHQISVLRAVHPISI